MTPRMRSQAVARAARRLVNGSITLGDFERLVDGAFEAVVRDTVMAAREAMGDCADPVCVDSTETKLVSIEAAPLDRVP